MRFADVLLDKFCVLFVYRDTNVLIYLGTAIPRILHSIWTAWLFAPILPLPNAMPLLFDFLRAKERERERENKRPWEHNKCNFWFFVTFPSCGWSHEIWVENSWRSWKIIFEMKWTLLSRSLAKALLSSPFRRKFLLMRNCIMICNKLQPIPNRFGTATKNASPKSKCEIGSRRSKRRMRTENSKLRLQ